MQAERVIGWDLGGAHAKAALVEAGRVVAALQRPCPVWLGLDRVVESVQAITQALVPAGATGVRHALTMTAEMADLFDDRRQGVARTLDTFQSALPSGTADGLVLFTLDGWCVPCQAGAQWSRIASANWQASARWIARVLADAVLVDVGSTTTDLIPVAAGRVAARGHDDASRLQAGELLYTGVVRTPVAAIADRLAWDGHWQPLAAELFATAADIHRLTGELDPRHDQAATADGRERTPAASAARLARMLCRDAGDAPLATWQALARQCARRQEQAIAQALEQVLSCGSVAGDAPLVAAGAGAFMAQRLQRRFDRRVVAFADTVPHDAARVEPHWLTTAAPAVAVALLAAAPCG